MGSFGSPDHGSEPTTLCTAFATVTRTFFAVAVTTEGDLAARVSLDRFVVFVATARAAVLRRAVFVAPVFTAALRAVVLDAPRFAAVFLAPPRAAVVFREPLADFALFFTLRPVRFRLATLNPPQGRILSFAPRVRASDLVKGFRNRR